MKKLKIHHETRYRFSSPIRLGAHHLMLRPREGPDLWLESSSLTVSPEARVRWARDPFDNAVATLTFDGGPAQELTITSEAVVQKSDSEPLDFVISDDAVTFPVAYAPEDADILRPFFANFSETSRTRAHAWATATIGDEAPIQTYTLLDRLCRAIKRDFTYQGREAPGVQSAEMTLERGAGSCRDFANLFMEAARALGLAARFVSGYRYDAGLPSHLGATHAWAEVYLPGAGWKGFDPTIGELADWTHIAGAVARSPTDAPPVAGVLHGAPVDAALYVTVHVDLI